ncbi:hypothetical protein JCM17823_13650 [Halorubrum gandharaense]
MAQDESTTDELLARLRGVGGALANAGEPVFRERPTMEHVLLLAFLVTGVYMYWGAREFSDAAAEFPQLMAGTTAVLAFLVLARNYLEFVAPLLAAGLGVYAVYTGGTSLLAGDGGLVRLLAGLGLSVAVVGFRRQLIDGAESFVAEPMQVLGEEDLVGDESEGPAAKEEPAAEEESAAMYVYEIDDPKGPIVTAFLCLAYMLVTFAIGMLYATPLFVMAWALWSRMEFGNGAALTGVGMLCSYLFYDLIQSDISEGWLTGWQPTPPDDLYDWYVDPLLQPVFRVIDQYVIFPLMRLIDTLLGVVVPV